MSRDSTPSDDIPIDPQLRGPKYPSAQHQPSDSEFDEIESEIDLDDLDIDADEFSSEEDGPPATPRRSPYGRGRGRGRGRAGISKRPADRSLSRPKKIRKDSKKYKTPEELAEFRRVNGLVTSAWLKEDYETALQYARDAIQLDPSQFSIHATIAEILQMRGQIKDAADALFIGVQSTHDMQNWWYVVDYLKNLTIEQEATRKKLIYCYSNILKKETDSVQARIGRMSCYQQHGSHRRARGDCLAALRIEPYNLGLLKLAAELSDNIDDPAGAVEPFEKFMQLRMQKEFSDDSALDWEVASSYIELLAQAHRFDDAVTALRQICRWLLGRQAESFWDNYDDDREWDVDQSRRLEVSEYNPDEFDDETYGLGLPVEFRVRLATLRLQQESQNFEEAMQHLNLLEPEEFDDADKLEGYVDLFLEAAETLRQLGHHKEALRFYEPLRNVAETLDAEFFFELAICYEALDRPEDVKSAIEGIKQGDRSASAQIGLAKLYHSQGKIDLMWKVCSQLKRVGRSDLLRHNGLPTTRPPELPAEPTKKFSHAKSEEMRPFRRSKVLREDEEQQERLRDKVILAMWNDISPLEHPLIEPDHEKNQQWLSVAHELYQDFRSQIAFFPRDKNTPFTGFGRYKFSDSFDPAASARQNKLEYRTPTTYRHISFDDWLDMLMFYAIRLADEGEREQCWDVLKDAEAANVNYCEPERYHIVRTTVLRCAIMLNDEERACREVRWFMKTYALAIDAITLSSASSRALHLLPSFFHDGPEQKYNLRQVKTMDWAVLTATGQIATRDEMFPGMPQAQIRYNHDKHDPCVYAQYGHSMLLGAAPSSSINYYFRAYAVAPQDPILHLHLGLGYISLALKRQSANRQYQIQQGLSFVHEYHKLRQQSTSALRRQEAEFNVGMVYHSLSLVHHALPAFERVIAMSAEVQAEALEEQQWRQPRKQKQKQHDHGLSKEEEEEEDEMVVVEDFAPEAALAMRSILALNGDLAAAHAITAQYLVL